MLPDHGRNDSSKFSWEVVLVCAAMVGVKTEVYKE